MKTLDIDDIAAILHKAKRTVEQDLRRRPTTLPPRLKIPGAKKPLWLESTVAEWLRGCEETRRRKQ